MFSIMCTLRTANYDADGGGVPAVRYTVPVVHCSLVLLLLYTVRTMYVVLVLLYSTVCTSFSRDDANDDVLTAQDPSVTEPLPRTRKAGTGMFVCELVMTADTKKYIVKSKKVKKSVLSLYYCEL